MAKRSHAVKKRRVPGGGKAEPNASAPLPVPEVVSEPQEESFLGWPSFLFEQLANPLRNVSSVVSWKDSWNVGSRLTVPKAQSSETISHYVYVVELPGISREQITLSFQNGALMLRAMESQRQSRYSGRKTDAYSHAVGRAFTLPVYTDAGKITAQLKDGLLTISIPKTDKPVWPTSRPIAIT